LHDGEVGASLARARGRLFGPEASVLDAIALSAWQLGVRDSRLVMCPPSAALPGAAVEIFLVDWTIPRAMPCRWWR